MADNGNPTRVDGGAAKEKPQITIQFDAETQTVVIATRNCKIGFALGMLAIATESVRQQFAFNTVEANAAPRIERGLPSIIKSRL